LVAKRLKSKEYLTLSRAEGTLSLPLARVWQTPDRTEPGWLLLPGKGAEPLRMDENVFLVHLNRLTCRAAATGVERWSCQLPRKPSWLCCFGDVVLAANADGVHGLSLHTGQPLWHFDPVALLEHPFFQAPPGPLSAFQLNGKHLLFLYT